MYASCNSPLSFVLAIYLWRSTSAARYYCSSFTSPTAAPTVSAEPTAAQTAEPSPAPPTRPANPSVPQHPGPHLSKPSVTALYATLLRVLPVIIIACCFYLRMRGSTSSSPFLNIFGFEVPKKYFGVSIDDAASPSEKQNELCVSDKVMDSVVAEKEIEIIQSI